MRPATRRTRETSTVASFHGRITDGAVSPVPGLSGIAMSQWPLTSHQRRLGSEIGIGLVVGFAGPFGEDGEGIVLGPRRLLDQDAVCGLDITKDVARPDAELLPDNGRDD